MSEELFQKVRGREGFGRGGRKTHMPKKKIATFSENSAENKYAGIFLSIKNLHTMSNMWLAIQMTIHFFFFFNMACETLDGKC